MSIVGAALIPITFGASIALLASGISMSVAGTAINLGFSFDKLIRDKVRKDKTKDCLKCFIDFQTKFLSSIANIFAARDEIHRLKSNEEIRLNDSKVCGIIKGYIAENGAGHTVGMMNLTDVLTTIMKQSEELMKCLQEVAKVIDMDLLQKEKDPLETIVNRKYDISLKLHGKSERELGGFAREYLQFRVEEKSEASGTFLPGLDALKAGVSSSVGTGALAARAAFGFSDDIFSAGGNALKIAQGISAASIVLSVLGVVMDVAFIGHAIYDLTNMKDNKEKFSQGLLDIADLMTIVSEVQSKYGDTEYLAKPEPRESNSSSPKDSTGHI